MTRLLSQVVPERARSVVIRAVRRWRHATSDVIAAGRVLRGGGVGLPVGVLDVEIAYNRHGAYCVPRAARHRPAGRCVRRGRVYEPATIRFLVDNADGGDIVHAGAFFGDFLPALARGVAPGATVWAFEPNAQSFRCAAITLGLNDISNVELVHAALGDRCGAARLRTVGADGRWLGGGSRIEDDAVRGETVPLVTVDEVVPAQRRVTILHLDVEGFEENALRGALGTIRRCRPVLVIEVLDGSGLRTGGWFSDSIGVLGYEAVAEVDGNTVFRADADAGGG